MPAWQQLASLRAGAMPPSRSMSPPSNVVVPSAAPPPIEMLDSEGKLRRAEQLAERRSFDDAMRILDDLVARDAMNADYQALRASILYQQFTGTQPSRQLHDTIERALRLNEAHPRALYIKAMVLKRVGKEGEAIRYLKRTLEADPRHIEAQRELRLAKMRRDK
jgi:tetratricopeptide (TPR) repeat protein